MLCSMSVWSRSVIAVPAGGGGAGSLAWVDGAELRRLTASTLRSVRSTLGLRQRIAGPLVGDRALRMLVPTRVLVVVLSEPRSHLHDGEHAAHLDRPKLRVARHHRKRVLG